MRRAFSLIEVVIAIGVVATALVVLLALLPAMVRSSSGANDSMIALQLPDAIGVELRRAAGQDLTGLANRCVPLSNSLPATLQLVATKDGQRVCAETFNQPAQDARIAEADQFFLIEVWQFTEPALAYDARTMMLALHVRVSWPYRTPNGMVPKEERESVSFSLSVRQ